MADEPDPARQQGDPHELDREDDPRGGVPSEEYRTSDPRDVVADEGVAVSGAAGAPQEGKSVEERRRESDGWRQEKLGDAGDRSPQAPS